MMKTKSFIIGECVLLMIAGQALRMGAQRLLAVGFSALSGKMLTMTAMLLLWLFSLAYIRCRRVTLPVFPQPFSRRYIIVTLIAVLLMASSPNNYIVGWSAVLELFYGCIVTPVFEETLFRGYFWQRLKTAYTDEKSVYLITTLLFTLWHLGYMLPPLLAGNWLAVGTKLLAGLIYGLIVGFVRLKSKNLYLPVLVHGIMNLFMI